MNQIKKVLIKLLLTIFVVTLYSCGTKTEDTRVETVGTPVQITRPKKTNLTEYITLNANTFFLKKEIVRATFQGFIEKIYNNLGDKISTGDLLLEIKTKESSADKNLELPIGDRTFSGIIKVYAKSDGVLTELNYNTGDFVSDGEQIAVISNPSSLRISLNVPYQYTSRINLNTTCDVYLPNGKSIKASIQKIIPKVDPAAQTQTYILNMNHAESLPENLNVNARIPLRTIKDAIVLPKTAVMSNETLDQFWIMKLIDDQTAVRVDIKKGIENDSLVQIINPELSLTDRIVTDGAFGMPDTSKIVIGK
jgi:multidrug efflux pump subunit AcrA (membrane-fusion protein)